MPNFMKNMHFSEVRFHWKLFIHIRIFNCLTQLQKQDPLPFPGTQEILVPLCRRMPPHPARTVRPSAGSWSSASHSADRREEAPLVSAYLSGTPSSFGLSLHFRMFPDSRIHCIGTGHNPPGYKRAVSTFFG